MAAAPKVCPLCGLRYDAAATFCQKDGAALTSAGDVDPFIGRMVLDQFRIDEPIGAGGMGTVYRAHQTTLGRDVAIKILHPELAANPDAVRRFHREARVATSLEHPNLVRVLLFGEFPEDGSLYLVMEHVAGRSLVEVLDHEGALPLPRALHVVTQICDAIGVAHAHGIVHRDVKPENVMLTERLGEPDFVKVLDFGIARMLWDQQTAQTQSGVIFGTARYISPEGASGETTDARSDVYSIGVLAYQLLTGVTPFEAGSPVAMLMKHIHDAAPPLRSRGEGLGVPQVVADVVMRALAKSPALRFDDASQMAFALREAASQAAVPLTGGVAALDRTILPATSPVQVTEPIVPLQGAPRARREPTPTAPVRREDTAALVADIPGLAGRPRWTTMLLAFALGATVVIGGVMAWRHFGDVAAETSPSELERAEAALAAGRFDEPAGDDVRTLTDALLARDPSDAAARRVRDEATRRLRELARGTLERDRARAAWDRVLAFAPDDVEAQARRAALDAPAEPRPGLRWTPAVARPGSELTLEAVLGEGTYGEDARFEIFRGARRIARVNAVRAGVERRWLATTKLRATGTYEVRFLVTGAPEPLRAELEIERATSPARREAPEQSAGNPRTTVVPTMRTAPAPNASQVLPPPMVVEDDGIDWSIPANMSSGTMSTMSTMSAPPPDTDAPPPWTG